MDMELNGLKFNNERADILRINFFDLKPITMVFFRRTGKQYEPLGGLHRFDRAVTSDLCVDSHSRG